MAVKNESLGQLKSNSLSFWEVFSQSLSGISLSSCPAFGISLIFANAGNGSWFAYFIATGAILAVAAQINVFARRSSSSGALYTFTVQGIGPKWGALSGWGLFLAYVFTASAVVAGVINYTSAILGSFDFQMGIPAKISLMLTNIFLVTFIAWKGIKMSTQLMLALEFICVTLIFVLIGLFFFKSGQVIDSAQISFFTALSPQGLRQALILGIFSLVGFEAAASLGGEAKNPLESIPKAINYSVLIAGGFFVIAGYSLILAFRKAGIPLDKSASPLIDLARFTGYPNLGLALAAVVVIGQFSCGIACINAAARIMYSMSHGGFFHRSIAGTHKVYCTPHLAVLISAAMTGIGPVILIARGSTALETIGYMGTLATFGFLLSYVLVSLSAPVYLWKRKELQVKEIATALVALFLLAVPIVGSVYPIPAPPYNYLPYIFLSLIALGIFRIAFLDTQSKGKFERKQNSLN